MAAGTAFPAFIRAEYDSGGGAFQRFQREAVDAGEAVRRKFETSFSEVQSVVQRALSIPRGAGGALDLDTSSLRRAAEDANAMALATRQVANASEILARETNDTTQATRLYIQAAKAAAIGAEEQSRDLNAQATTYERLQAEIDKTKASTDRLVTASSSGVIANRSLAKSAGAVRQATLQAGQQLQDISISLYSGQRAGVVFAQQLPQLAFALSGLSGQSNKTLSAIGKFGTFLAGPWGLAVGLGVGVLATLASKLISGEDASDKLTLALDVQKNSYKLLTKSVKDYNDEQEKSKELTFVATVEARRVASENLTKAETRLSGLRDKFSTGNFNSKSGQELKSGLAAQIKGAQEQITALRKQLGEAQRAVIGQEVDAQIDKSIAITNKYDEQIRKLTISFDKLAASRRVSAAEEKKYRTELLRLETAKKKEVDAFKKSERDAKKETRSQQQILNDFKAELAKRGQRVISDVRTAAEQNALFKQGLTPLDGYKRLSRHQSKQAVDLDKRVFNEQKVREAAQAAGLKGLEIVTESGGRKHAEFTGAGKKGEVDTAGNERAVAAAARETERLSRISDSAAESIQRINEQFDDQPRLVDRSAQAVRKLDDIITELNAPKNKGTPRLKELLRDAEQAKQAAQNAISTDFGRQREQDADRLKVQKLIIAGREDEANVVERLQQLEQRYGLGRRLEDLQEQLRVAHEIADTEDSTGKEREASLAIIARLTPEYERLSNIQKGIVNDVTNQVENERQINIQLQIRNEQISRYQSNISELRSALEGLFSGGSTKEFFSSITDGFKRLRAGLLTQSLFGESLRELDQYVRRNDPVNVATTNLVEQTKKAATGLDGFTQALGGAAAALNGTAANDNSPVSALANAQQSLKEQFKISNDLIVNGQRNSDRIIGTSLRDFAERSAKAIVDPLTAKLDATFGTSFFSKMSGVLSGALAGYLRAGKVGAVIGGIDGIVKKIPGKTAEGISDGLGKALQGAETGDQAAQLLRSIGIKTSRTGGQIGGALGEFGFGPIGGLVGGIIGSVVGGLFKKTPKGSAVITNTTTDAVVNGNKSAIRDNLTNISGGLQDSLRSIADRLGGELGNFAVSIGQRKDEFRVSASGSSNVGDKKFAKRAGSDLLYVGKDPEEAARVALLNAIQDGAITGIREGAKRLLQAGKDIDTAVQKALDFESVFTRLKAYKDPVGAALDTLDKEFTRLRKIFAEAGSSTEDYAKLEELYGIERAKAVKEAGERLTASLQSLLDDLTLGDNGRSLRDRLSAAQSAYDPLAARVAAGDKTAYDDFAAAAKTLLDIQRQFSGSQTPYFQLLNEVTDLTRTRIETETNIAAISANRDTPFDSNGNPTGTASDNAAVVGAIQLQTQQLLNGFGSIISSAFQQTASQRGTAVGSGGGGGFKTNISNL